MISILCYTSLTPYPDTSLFLSIKDLSSASLRKQRPSSWKSFKLQERIHLHYFIFFVSLLPCSPIPVYLINIYLRTFSQPRTTLSTMGRMSSGYSPSAQSVSSLVGEMNEQISTDTEKSYCRNKNLIFF